MTSQSAQWRADKHAEYAANPKMKVPHGKRSTYDNYGCRCTLCLDAKGIGRPLKHGTLHTYQHHGCRCEPCKTRVSNYNWYQREIRHARLLKDPTLAPHGHNSTYVGWNCRCRPCKAAAKRYREDRIARKADERAAA